MTVLQKIGKILGDSSLVAGPLCVEEVPLLQNIHRRMELAQKLTFILPAFPAKSPSREKTSGETPDFGEVLALQNLQRFCEKINQVYPPGSEIIICSDGRVFSDVVNVPDEAIDRYNEGIQAIVSEYDLSALKVFAMDHVYPDLKPAQLRSLLLETYAADLESVKNRVRSESSYNALFNGIHRFLCEDELFVNRNLSRSAAKKKTKESTYELLRRSEAWSELLKAHFPEALRLSIHPHTLGHEKFGIKMIPSSDKWATPWHNVTVKTSSGFQLMHQREALGLRAVLRWERGKYAYFEVPTTE